MTKPNSLMRTDLPLEERAKLLRDPSMRQEVKADLAANQYIFETLELYDVLQELSGVFTDFYDDAITIANTTINKQDKDITLTPEKYIEAMIGLTYVVASNGGSPYTPKNESEKMVIATAPSFMLNFYRKIWQNISDKNYELKDISPEEEKLINTLKRIESIPRTMPQLAFIGTQ